MQYLVQVGGAERTKVGSQDKCTQLSTQFIDIFKKYIQFILYFSVKSFLFIASTSKYSRKYFLSQISFMQCHLKLKLAPLNFILSTIILQDKLIINTYLYTTGLLEIVFNINIHLPYIYNSKSNTGHHLKNNHIYINKQYRYNFVGKF